LTNYRSFLRRSFVDRHSCFDEFSYERDRQGFVDWELNRSFGGFVTFQLHLEILHDGRSNKESDMILERCEP